MEHYGRDMLSKLEEYVRELEEKSAQLTNLHDEKRELNKKLEERNKAILALQLESKVIVRENQDLEAKCTRLSSEVRNSDFVETISDQAKKVKELEAHIEMHSRTVVRLKDEYGVSYVLGYVSVNSR